MFALGRLVVEAHAPGEAMHVGRRYHVSIGRLDGTTEFSVFRLKRADDGSRWLRNNSNTTPPIALDGPPMLARLPWRGNPISRATVHGIVVGCFIFEE